MRCFSSLGSLLDPMYSNQDTLTGGFPHSEIRGSKLTRSSPRLIAACHVLHRLSMPRHPPNALMTLDPSVPRAGAMSPPAFPDHFDAGKTGRTALSIRINLTRYPNPRNIPRYGMLPSLLAGCPVSPTGYPPQATIWSQNPIHVCKNR